MNILLFIVSFALILLGCEFFTNAVEWMGKKLNLAEGAVGSILAAVGTALPETLVPLIAILFIGGEAGEDIGVGAILGAPFMLATLALFVTGLAVFFFRRRRMRNTLAINGALIRRDLKFFLLAYSLAAIVAFLPAEWNWARWMVGLSLIPIYTYYTWVTLRTGETVGDHDCKTLYLQKGWKKVKGCFSGPKRKEAPETESTLGREPDEIKCAEGPSLATVLVQLLLGLAGIVFGVMMFVEQVKEISLALGISETILALIIAPMATELPEMFNSQLWVRGGKDTFAIGNITGAMVFQSCFPVTIGVLLTQWYIDISDATQLLLAISIGIALLSAVIMVLRSSAMELRPSALGLGGVLYLAFIICVVVLL